MKQRSGVESFKGGNKNVRQRNVEIGVRVAKVR